MIQVTTRPNQFEAACNRILHGLEPLRRELAALPELDAAARKRADIAEVRRLQGRTKEMHEQLVELAAIGKRELQTFLDEFVIIAGEERQRVDDALVSKQKERDALHEEYEQRLAEVDQAITRAEREQHEVYSDLQVITQTHIATVAQLSAQIDESLKVA